MMYKPHWPNPWEGEVVYVPIEELAACCGNIGKSCRLQDGSSIIDTEETVLAHWRTAGDKLDAYILPQASGWHDIGIRYGAEGSEYLSPMADKKKTQALMEKYQGQS